MKINEAYNIWAKQYDSNKNRTRDLDQKVTIKTLSNYDFNSVLELGCGTGKNTKWLLERSENIVGLDFSTEMLRIAKSKFQSNAIKFVQTDLTQDWNIENCDFDLVTCSLTLEHIENLSPIFNQVEYHLRDGGIFFICELHPFKQYLGSGARFDLDNETHTVKVFTHHISEYLGAAKDIGFETIEIEEWFDDVPKMDLPRLISFVFRKK